MTDQVRPVRGGEGAPATEPEAAVRLRGVGRVFTTADRLSTTALKEIDLDISRGEFVSLIGPSGCGKSTLLRIVGDLIAPTSGEVLVNGKTAVRARRDRDYGMVFQAPVLFEWRTVEDNVKLPLEVMGYDAARQTARVKEMLDLVELGDFSGHRPWQLSGGMQQRVAIARALAFEPSILLMDEPFGALDEMTRERMNQEVQRIWQQTGITILFVTHSIPEAVFLSSRVVVMSARPGQITHVIDIDLPRPRTDDTRETERYFELVTEVREALRGRRSETGGGRNRVRTAHPGRGGGRLSASAPAMGPAATPRQVPAARRLSRRISYYLPTGLVFVGVLIFWELAVTALELKAFLFPRPSAIATALFENWGGGQYSLLASWLATLLEAVGGLVIGTAAGLGAALITARFISARHALMPLAIAANAIPIVAFAPLMNNWFGTLSPLSKMMMAAILVFFPVMANVTRGLVQVDASALELMRSYAAGESAILRKVRLPNALPFFFTALKLATTLSLIGAVVAEYFGGSSLVLGRIIVQSSSALRFDITWAAVLLAAATGIVLYLAVAAVERVVIPWHASMRSPEP